MTAQQHLDRINSLRRLLNQPLLIVPSEILEYVENEMSPENLCCDGEATSAQIKAKLQMLNALKSEALRIQGTLRQPNERTYNPKFKVNDQVLYKGRQYKIVKVLKVNYRLLDESTNKQYNIKIYADCNELKLA